MKTLSGTLEKISRLEAVAVSLENSIKHIDKDSITSDVLDILKDISQLHLEIAACYSWIKYFA